MLTPLRALLRWKVVSDYNLQNRSIKRFAICSRINYAVAIYRLMWTIEMDRSDRVKSLSVWKKLLMDFDSRASKIRKEIYSKRRQLQHAFRMIKLKYCFLAKVKQLERCTGRILHQQNLLRSGFFEIAKAAKVKSKMAIRLVEAFNTKLSIALETLFSLALKKRASENDSSSLLVELSVNILQKKSQNNLETICSLHKMVSRGASLIYRLVSDKAQLELTNGFQKVRNQRTASE